MTGRSKAPLDGHDGMDQAPKGFDDYELVLGDILRGERATLGKSLLDVQREIKIKAGYIAAIEAGDLSAFETPGFIAGYVRSYGRYLGLDPDLVYQAFCEQTGFSHLEGLEARVYATDRSQPKGRARPRPVPATGDAVLARNPIYTAPRTSPWEEIRPGAIGSLAALLTLLGGLGYGAWSLLQSIQQVTLAPVEAPVVALDIGPEQAPDSDAAPGAVSTPSAEALMQLYRPQALDVPVLVARDGPISTLDPTAQGIYAGLGPVHAASYQVATAVPPPAGEKLGPELIGPHPQSAAAATVAVAAAADGGEVTVVAAPPPELVMFARNPVWVRVKAADGTVLLEKILETGERYVLPQTEHPPVLRAGNSGSLFFAVNGQTIGPAGPGTSVAKNVEMSVTALNERYRPVDLAQDADLKRLAELVMAPETPPVQ